MKKILLTCRYRNTLQKYTNLLANWGVHIHATTSGSEALKAHNEQNFDLIVSDFELEDMGGCSLCSLIRKNEKLQRVPVIITCHDIASRIERAKLSGATHVAMKPIDPVKLLTAIGEQLGLNLIRGKRVAVNIAVTIQQNCQEFICYSSDISSAGILIKSDYPLNLGERITCRFNLPDYGTVETGGEIVRYMTDLSCDNLYGINFISMQSCFQKAICDYIASFSHRYSASRPEKSDSFSADRNKRQAVEVAGPALGVA